MINDITGLPNRISHLREDVIIDGTLTINNGNQGAGLVLTSDANGLVTWQSISGSSSTSCSITGGTLSAGTLTLTNCTGGTAATITGFSTGSTGGISEYAMFYGLTTGTGNGGANDYASSVAVKTGAGTGRVPFPRSGATLGNMTISTGTTTPALSAEVNIPSIGVYEVSFEVTVTEATGGQLQLELTTSGVPADLPETVCANRSNAIAGMHPISGNFIITTTAINSKLAVVNCSGNAAALTISPADTLTHANAQRLIIKKIA